MTVKYIMEQPTEIQIEVEKKVETQLDRFAKRNIVMKWILRLVRHGYVPIILIVGQMGAGKSMTALSYAYSLKKLGIKEFDITKDLIHSVEDYVNRLMEGITNHVLILDEASVRLNSKSWWDIFNISVEKLITSQRYKGNMIIIVLPQATQLSKAIRKLVDIKIELLRKRLAKFTIIQKNYGEMGFGGKWSKQPIYEWWIPVKFEIPKLDKELVKEYRAIEQKDKQTILEQIAEQLQVKKGEKEEKVWL